MGVLTAETPSSTQNLLPMHPELCPGKGQMDRQMGSIGNKVSASAPGETRGWEKAKGRFSFSTKIDGEERNR